MRDQGTIYRLLLWIVGAVVGLGIIFGTAFGEVGAILVALLAIPLGRLPKGSWGVAGTLTSFGAIWLVLMLAQSMSGGRIDNAAFWAAVGAIPLAAGIAWTALLAWSTGRDAEPD